MMKTLLVIVFALSLTSVGGAMTRAQFGGKKPSASISTTTLAKALEEVRTNLANFQAHRAETMALRRNGGAGLARIAAERDLEQRAPGAQISWNESNNTVAFISAPVLYASGIVPFAASPAMMADAARAFLAQNAALTGMKDPAHEFTAVSQTSDELGDTHLRLQQVYLGVPVWGGQAIVHFDAAGNLYCFDGRYYPTPSSVTSVQPAVSSPAAIHTVSADLSRNEAIEPPSRFNALGLQSYTGPQAEKMIYVDRTRQIPRLAWHITIRPNLIDRWEYFVDANTGAVLFKYYNTWADGPATAAATDLNGAMQTVRSYQIGGTYYMIDASEQMFNAAKSQLPGNPVGAIWTLDAQNTDATGNLFQITSTNNAWTDPASVSAEYDAGTTYNYYRTIFNRNSIDNNGMTIISVIHVTENGQGMDNAFWNGTEMIYGDGLTDFKPLAGGLDVGAHELTHGVTEHSANLVYLDQSGALNESMSDVFGKMVDVSNWQLGTTIVKPGVFPHNALRDMADPHNGGNAYGDLGWQPAVMSEYVTLPETQDGDNGGVHTNSGIPNHACYLIAQQIGRPQTQAIYYRALTVYLTSNAQFIDARHALTQAAQDLYGANAVNAVKSAFDQVQVYDTTGTPPPGNLPEVQGPEWMLAVNALGNDLSLYRIQVGANNKADSVQLITSDQIYSRPSITDDGQVAVYVNQSHNLMAVVVNTAPATPSALNSSGLWESCAISRDGNSIALTPLATLDINKIYVLNDSSGTWVTKAYTLYTPATEKAQSNAVRYAQMMDWDPAGENILYDCYNVVQTANGDSIGYWDIALLNAWNAQSKTFGTGMIQRVVPPQQQGVEIGNPSFSKNTPYIFAFDKVDFNAGSSQIMGANMLTGATGKIADNYYLNSTDYTVGYPTYSRDDKSVAFTDFDDINLRFDIDVASVDETKIAGVGVDTFAVYAQMPVWYTIGSRPVGVGEPAAQPSQTALGAYPNPAANMVNFTVHSAHNGAFIVIYNMLGEEVSRIEGFNASGGAATAAFDASPLANGIYYAALHSGGKLITKQFSVVH